MRLPALGVLLLACFGCHGFFGQRTNEADQELNSFAEARQRAATYYDGGDYARAAAQYREAHGLRPQHFMTHLGLAYSLMYENLPSSLVDAEKEFEEIGERRDPKEEVKRIFGLGLTYRSLAAYFDKRSRLREQQGQVKGAAEDDAQAKENARKGLTELNRVLELDAVLARDETVAPKRVSASLTPDAHVAMAHCEILLMDPSRPSELDAHVTRAREHIEEYARIAANARKFWELQREQVLVVDPMADPSRMVSADAAMKKRYEERIANTLKQEVAVRRVLFNTLLYVNRYEEAIAEAGTILDLDPGLDEVVYQRGRAYLFLEPPDLRSALRDLKEYRSRLPLGRLTDELVQLNRDIKKLERDLEKQETTAARDG